MSGHSKWSQIKRQKGVEDSKKSQVFSKMARLISIAAKKGDDPNANSELRAVVERAKAENMPIDNIERAIKKGAGKLEGVNYEAGRYEAYGPGGTALIINIITDSKNRTTNEIKQALTQHGAKLAEQGSVLWAFEFNNNVPSPKTTIPLNDEDKNKLDTLIEILNENEDVQEIYHNAMFALI